MRNFTEKLVQNVKNGVFSQEDAKKLQELLAQNPTETTALLKTMYETMLGDLANPNPAVFASAYNAARIIHASLPDKSHILSDAGMTSSYNSMLACLQEEKINTPTNTKAQNIKAYGAAAFKELLEDANAKHSPA